MSKYTQITTQKLPKLKGNISAPLDTLAHSYQKGQETLNKRAFSKYYTSRITLDLIALKNEREGSYRNALYCANTIIKSADGKCTTTYCKTRWCITCNRIRTGILINTYKPLLDTRKSYFVTLTTNLTKTCKTKQDLSATLDRMQRAFAKVVRGLKKWGYNVSAIRKTEVTYSNIANHFHPHYHIIVCDNWENKGIAEDMVLLWLKEFPKASKTAQSIGITDENSVLELFKYTTKMWDKQGTVVMPYPAQKLDIIYSALHRKKVISVYGDFRNIKEPELDEFTTEDASIYLPPNNDNTDQVFHWNENERTWVDEDSGECLTTWKFYSEIEFFSG
jgi:hypothetical protein